MKMKSTSGFKALAGRFGSAAGFTLIEANAATAMVGSFVAALLVMNSNLLGVLKSTKETASASQALQERVEDMRISNFAQITSSSYVKNTLFAARTSSSSGLTAAKETITVTPYASDGVTNTTASMVVERSATGSRILTDNAALVGERMVRVDVKVEWTGSPNRRHRTRTTTALIAKGGISK